MFILNISSNYFVFYNFKMMIFHRRFTVLKTLKSLVSDSLLQVILPRKRIPLEISFTVLPQIYGQKRRMKSFAKSSRIMMFLHVLFHGEIMSVRTGTKKNVSRLNQQSTIFSQIITSKTVSILY